MTELLNLHPEAATGLHLVTLALAWLAARELNRPAPVQATTPLRREPMSGPRHGSPHRRASRCVE